MICIRGENITIPKEPCSTMCDRRKTAAEPLEDRWKTAVAVIEKNRMAALPKKHRAAIENKLIER